MLVDAVPSQAVLSLLKSPPVHRGGGLDMNSPEPHDISIESLQVTLMSPIYKQVKKNAITSSHLIPAQLSSADSFHFTSPHFISPTPHVLSIKVSPRYQEPSICCNRHPTHTKTQGRQSMSLKYTLCGQNVYNGTRRNLADNSRRSPREVAYLTKNGLRVVYLDGRQAKEVKVGGQEQG